MKIIFGTDGWRGLLGSELNPDNVGKVALAFSKYLHKQGGECSVAVGFDGRNSSREFATVFAGVLSAQGITVYLSDGVIPTPVLSFQTHQLACSAGVMITASHNPPAYNGIKFKSRLGGPFFTEETRKVEELIDDTPVKVDSRNVHVTSFLPTYLDHIRKLIDINRIRQASLRPLIDSMAGAGGKILGNFLKEEGIFSSTIYGEPLPDFGGRMAEPIAKNLEALSVALRQGTYSLGLATDGDADRIGAMQENGEWMNIQETILYLAKYLKQIRKFPGGLVKTLSVTDKLKILAREEYCEVFDVQVGFKYISETMTSHKIAFGAEESGGFGFYGHVPERDGILSALFILEMLAHSGHKRLSDFIREKRKESGKIHYDRIDHPYHNPDRNILLSQLTDRLPETVNSWKIQDILLHNSSRGEVNSLKLILEGSPRWLLMRSSETEPMVRIYAEGESDDEVRLLLREGMKWIES